jgi:chromosome segregation ATPase
MRRTKPRALTPEAFKDIKPPPLILDALWQEHFRGRKTPKISALEARIKELMIDNARNREEERTLDSTKKGLLSRMLALSEEAANGSAQAQKALAQAQAEVLAINKKLQALEKKAWSLPDEQDKASRELLCETVSIIYEQMRQAQAKLKALEPESERLRKELERVVREQAGLEEDAARTYQLLHNLAGQEILDALDDFYKRGL